MKSLKTLLLTKSLVAAAIATTGVAAPALSHANPADGMVCRAGYAGALDGTHFKCSKTRVITVALECNNLRFPTYVTRAPGAPGDTSGGKDLCTRAGVNIGPGQRPGLRVCSSQPGDGDGPRDGPGPGRRHRHRPERR